VTTGRHSLATLRPATPDDLPAITALLEAAHLPPWELEQHLDNFVVAEQDGRVVGAGGLETYPNCAAGLVRSMAVDEPLRGTGLGRRILEWVMQRAADDGLPQIFLFTRDAREFYVHFGFSDVTLDEFPEAMHTSAQYQGVKRFGKEFGIVAMTKR